MKTILKNISALILPVTVLILIPMWIENKRSVPFNVGSAAGFVFMVAGLTVMVFTISSFIRIGKGTLAPWAPTKKLVVTGLYRYVRNPMILGVCTVLLGEGLCLRSWQLLVWAGIFFTINTVYFILSEEPGLEKRFGDEYRDYKKHVPRWIPRLTPYRPHPPEKS